MLMMLQGKGLMTTHWLTGEKIKDNGSGAGKSDESVMNHDEGIDDIDENEITFTFHVSEPTNSDKEKCDHH